MKELLTELRRAVLATVALAVVCCGLYPLVVFGLGQALFPHKANGSLIVDAKGQVLGSRLIGQPFTADKYFHPRPSSAGNGYDATSSGGSNLGPDFAEAARRYRPERGRLPHPEWPGDECARCRPTRSPARAAGWTRTSAWPTPNSRRRAWPRPAACRWTKVRALIAQNTDPADLGFLGEPGVNVLALNLALDRVP